MYLYIYYLNFLKNFLRRGVSPCPGKNRITLMIAFWEEV
jgi:hypothetical protein